MAEWTLAIDFGTTSTAAAMRVGATVERIEIDGAPRMPSMVFWREGTSATQTGRLVLGEEADQLSSLAPWCLERTPKRHIGDEFILLGEKELRVTEVIGAILRKVADEAMRLRGGELPAELRLTHPARWGRTSLDKLGQAAKIAGFDAPVFIPEPVAAAMHFASARLAPGQQVAVYDLGGGTFDTAVLRRTADSFEVIGAPGGNDDLGGEDFDDRLYRYLGRQLARDKWQALSDSKERPWMQANRELLRNARRTKEFLSRSPQHEFYVPPPVDQELLASAETFRELIIGDVESTVVELERTIHAAGLEPRDLAAIYLAGGSSRIPLVARMIQRRLGQLPESLDDPKAVTALGAARVPISSATTARSTAPESDRAPTRDQVATVLDEPENLDVQASALDEQATVLDEQATVLDPEPAVLQDKPTVEAERPFQRDVDGPQPSRAPPGQATLIDRATRFAQPLMIAACVALAGVSFLKWFSHMNFWHFEHSLHFKVAIAGLLVAVVALSVFTVTRRGSVWSLLAGAAGLFAGGGLLGYAAEDTSYFSPETGVYLGIVCGVVLSAGGLIALLGLAVPSRRIAIADTARAVAKALMIAGCVALAGVSFLHWFSSANFWHLEQSLHFKVVVVASVVAVVVLSAFTVTRRGGIWSRLAVAAGLFAAGVTFFYTIRYTSFHPEIGAYLGLVCAGVVGIGGLIAVLALDEEPGP